MPAMLLWSTTVPQFFGPWGAWLGVGALYAGTGAPLPTLTPPDLPHQPTLIRHHPDHLGQLPTHADVVGMAQAAVEVK